MKRETPPIRHNQMHKTLLVVTAMLLLPAAGCGGTSDTAGVMPASSSSAPTGAGASAPADQGTSAPGTRAPEHSGAVMPRSSPPPDHPPKSSPRPSPSASRGDPDNPRDLVGAPVVLTGTVEADGSCVILTAHGRRWALVGP